MGEAVSASEKLKALGEQMDAAAKTIVPRQSYYDAAWELHHALPQIVAAVEADEEFLTEAEEDCLASDATWPPSNARDDIVARKYRALAALEEVLG